MNMSTFLKRNRMAAGLTQAQLAERMKVSVVAVQNWEAGKTKINQDRYRELSLILNIPIDTLIKEMVIDDDKKKEEDNWPDFLFDGDTNDLIDTLHLNLIQQELFGLLCLYSRGILEDTNVDRESFKTYLRKVPYEFISHIGIIQFMNQADYLFKVLKRVKSTFLLKVLKLYPDTEFNIRKLPKELICEFIDNGYNEIEPDDDFYDEEDGLRFNLKMRDSKIMLPILEKYGKIHLADGKRVKNQPVREDIPEEVKDGIIEMFNLSKRGVEAGYFKDWYNFNRIEYSLPDVTEVRNEAPNGKEEYWTWEINELGRELLRWFNNEEEKPNKQQ